MFPLLRDRLPLAAFVLVLLIGWSGAAALWRSADRTEALRFAAAADEATNRIRERIRVHLLLIEATAAIVEAQGETLTASRFAEYFDKLQLAERNPGIAGLGFAPLAPPQGRADLNRRLAAEYGPQAAVWPAEGSDPIAPVAVIGSLDPDPPPVIGFDMYSEPTRRRAMQAAAAARAPRATEPLTLATDAEPTPGFIIYAPVYAASFGTEARVGWPDAPTGFAFGGFRTGELAGAALHAGPPLPIALTLADADAPGERLYSYGAASRDAGGPGAQVRSLGVADQTWTLTFLPTAAFSPALGRRFALGFAAISATLAAAVASALREQERARSAAETLAEASQINLAEKDLLLQEMQHRIKNAIARILAIARQTAARSGDIDGFIATFASRLEAMAEAQKLLTSTVSERADLAELLARELFQVFGPDFDPSSLSGPKVELDASRTQALGLVFHELGTNALKHAGGCGVVPAVDVRWTVTEDRSLDLQWRETGGRRPAGPPERVGFGTRLIDATLNRELGGRVERDWRPEGLSLRMVLPLGLA